MLYLTLVLFCTTNPFFRQTIIGAGAPSAKHHKNEVWLYSTNCFVATWARVGVTEWNKFHEISSVVFTYAYYMQTIRELFSSSKWLWATQLGNWFICKPWQFWYSLLEVLISRLTKSPLLKRNSKTIRWRGDVQCWKHYSWSSSETIVKKVWLFVWSAKQV